MKPRRKGEHVTVTSTIGEIRPEHDSSQGRVLVHFVRGYAVPIVEVWARLTEFDQLPTWFGTVEGAPESDTTEVALHDDCLQRTVMVRTRRCIAPHHLDITVAGSDLDITLHQVGVVTSLEVAARHLQPAQLPSTGPRMQYYLDRLDAVLTGAELPRFDNYRSLADEYRWVIEG